MSKKKGRRKIAAQQEAAARAMVSVDEVLKRSPATVTQIAAKSPQEWRRVLGANLKN
ncbi:MAG: hypothetical protein WAV50_01355 [Minisyncoccia bacterium]